MRKRYEMWMVCCLAALMAALVFTGSPVCADIAPNAILNPQILQQNLQNFTITTETLPDATVGEPYKAELEACCATEPYSWSVEDTLPPGLNIDYPGLIYGTPTEAGDYTFTVIVSDSSAGPRTREKSFTISVADKMLRMVQTKPLLALLPAAPSNLTAIFGPDYPTTQLAWKDNSYNETGFVIWRKAGGAGDYQVLTKTAANTTSYIDYGSSGLPGEEPMNDLMLQSPNTTFSYKVAAYNAAGSSAFSNVATYTTPLKPANVSNFNATVVSGTSIRLRWSDNSDNETGFILHRGPKLQEPPDNWGQFCKDSKLPANTTECTDTGLVTGKTYVYRVWAYNPYESNIGNSMILEATPFPIFKLPEGTPLTIKLHIDNPNMEINGVSQEIDPGRGIAPVIVNGRTMLPVRALIESMGGSLTWDESERKVVVQNGSTQIDLWIGSNSTRVNGVEKYSDVPPAIINDRTMLPLRYITENLGYTVRWDEKTREIIVEYANE